MPKTYEKKKNQRPYGLYTIVTVFLLFAVFFLMVGSLFVSAENDAYEDLHVQTKQIKDDLILQLISDRENLSTMANFASKLYKDGESYDLLFESFKPIGLIENVGILTPENVFITKAGTIDLSDKISFEDEKARGAYVSGRIKDLTRDNYELVRSAVPIKADGQVIGILYGVIKLDTIEQRYEQMANDIDAQLFVYSKDTGDLIIDNVHTKLGNISFLKDREYARGYSYEQIISSDKGFTSFKSAYRDEQAHMHFSTIEELGWIIALTRYDSNVFAEVWSLAQVLFIAFIAFLVVVGSYVTILLTSEKHLADVTDCAADIRKLLLDTSGGENAISFALKQLCQFARARSTMLFDANSEEFHYLAPKFMENTIPDEERNYFRGELLLYGAEVHQSTNAAVNVLSITPNKHLLLTNPTFYEFLRKYKIDKITCSATVNATNHVTILAAVNPKRFHLTRLLIEKIAACFSMALYNKNYLNQTKLTATTDSLTGALNRVAYKTDLLTLDAENASDFSCIYVDVNELHLINNTRGHAAGDEMLIYVANTLKEVFFGHSIYRMGGDEFLVFCRNADQETVKKNIEFFVQQLQPKNYHVAIGYSFRTRNTDTESMVKEAEVRMYEAKAKYYQNKEQRKADWVAESEYVQVKTGILEIDTMLSILKESYNGIYRVSLNTDKAHRILMPAYLNYNENEEHFSKLFSKYVADSVEPDYHRVLLSFLNYEAIRQQLLEGKIPKATYKKHNGEMVTLSVYTLDEAEASDFNTLWVFAKM